MAVTANQPRS